MPKFRIEMELQDINERILIANFDSKNNKTEAMTFNETLTENENDQFSLTFSIANKFNRNNISIGSYISVNRPLWLHLDDQNKSIRMAITSFSTVIGPDNIIYQVEAQDYASSMFSKNNAGLTVDTITSLDYMDFKNQRSFSDSNEVVANYILERGWLRKHVSGTTYSGWEAEFVDYDVEDDGFVNISVSDSNTYNALVTLANLTYTNIEIDYEAKKFYFIKKNGSQYQTEYTLRKDFNLKDFSLSYASDNLYGLMYVKGGQDVDQNFVTLSEAVDYKDNFLYDLSYFESKNLIANDTLSANISNLTTINTNLSNLVEQKFTKEFQISDYRATVRAEAEEAIAPNGSDNFIVVDSLFKTKDFDITTSVEEDIIVDYEANWLTLDTSTYIGFKFPIKVSYVDSFGKKINRIIEEDGVSGVGYLEVNSVQIAQISFTEPTGDYETFTQDGLSIYFKYLTVDWSPYFSALSAFGSCTSNTSAECLITSDVGNTQIICNEIYPGANVFAAQQRVCSYLFEPSKLSITSVTGTREETVTVLGHPNIYPYFQLLDEYDGSTAINNEKALIQDEIDLWISEWEKDYAILQDSEETEYNKEAAQQRINDYAKLIGDYDPVGNQLSSSKLGVLTLIKDRFEAYEDDYTASADAIMPQYRTVEKQKKDFWYDLKENKQHIFTEGYYSNEVETTAENLLPQATAIYSDHKIPTESFGITYIDASDLLSVNLEKLKVGQFIKIENDDYKIISTEESKIRIMSISRTLRDSTNISLQISRYNLYDVIVENLAELAN